MASLPQAASNFDKTYNSFSGVDIKAVLGSSLIGEIQAISYSITREKAPIYTMGHPDPRAFSRGKRGIAGTLIFVMFDKHPILHELAGIAGRNSVKFSADKDEYMPTWAKDRTVVVGPDQIDMNGDYASEPVGRHNRAIRTDQMLAKPWYVDQILPFDITMAAANEYGALSVMRIIGCELLNEGYGVSVDDIVSEQQFTFIARSVLPWVSIEPDFSQDNTGSSSLK